MKTNEFGLRLSGAGYAPSILEPERAGCALCGRTWGAKLDRHEPWGGANREKSKGLGLWVSLCHWGCHEGPGSVHDDPARARALRRWAQAQAMAVYGWDTAEWRRRFGKSEIAEGEALEPILREGLSEFGMLNSKFGMMEARPAGRGGRFVNRPYGGGAKEGTDCHTSAAALVRNDRSGGFRVCLDGPELPY